MDTDGEADTLLIGGAGVAWSWAMALLREACSRVEPPVEIVATDAPADPGAPAQKGTRRRVLVARHPDRAVMDTLGRQRAPVVVVVDDPVDSIRWTMLTAGCDVVNALRNQTASAAAHHLCLDHPRALIVQRGTALRAWDVATAILSHMGLALDPAARDAVLEGACGPPAESWTLETALEHRVEGYRHLDQLKDIISASDASMVRQVLSPMIRGAIRSDIGAIVWPSRVFLFGDVPNTPPPAVVDLTGSARTIYYGPYFHLPPGTWRVEVVLAVSPEVRGQAFQLNVYSNLQPLSYAVIRPDAAGAFQGTFTVRHREPQHSVEINLIILEGMIEGHLALGQITFTRIAP